MLFNSLSYAIFLPLVFILYWALPHRYRRWLLLAASYYFYMSWSVRYVALILFMTGVSYIAALLLEYSKESTPPPTTTHAQNNYYNCSDSVPCSAFCI